MFFKNFPALIHKPEMESDLCQFNGIDYFVVILFNYSSGTPIDPVELSNTSSALPDVLDEIKTLLNRLLSMSLS